MTDELHFRLRGRFRVTDGKGVDRTPRSLKAQGILALLLTSTEFDRARLWLQDKLWSDRPQKQGSDSLRQALRDIRKSFGEYSKVLKTDRRAISLEPDLVIVDEPLAQENSEFLEGFDIKDPEFNIWLSAQRAATEDDLPLRSSPPIGVAPRRRTQVLFLNETEQPGMLQLLENQFIETVSLSIKEELNLDILRKLPQVAEPGILVASVQAFQDHTGRIGLRASIEDVDGNRVLWSQMTILQMRGATVEREIEVLALGHQMALNFKSITADLPSTQLHSTDANVLALMAVRKIFSLQYDQLEEAETMLRSAFEIEGRGVYQSWLAQLFSIQLIERAKSVEDIRDKSEAACALALELEPENSNVLASVADANLVVKRNFLLSAELAKQGVMVNPANPLAWWTLASGHLYLDNRDEAHRAALNSQVLAGSTRLRFWADIQCGLTALVKGKTVQGLRHLEASSALSPEFRAPLRYRTAVYSAAGMTEAAMDSSRALTKVEPTFSFDRLANDPDYPVSLMRKHGMLDTITFT